MGAAGTIIDGAEDLSRWAEVTLATVVPGNPAGLELKLLAELAAQGVHVHCYGDVHRGFNRAWIEGARQVAPEHVHFHPHVGQDQWVSELSRYDAGWLHLFRSGNRGDLRRADWEDLNYPARLPTLASAGLPLIQLDNRDAIVATQSLTRQLNIGLYLADVEQLAGELHNKQTLVNLSENAWRQRELFTFDYHVDRLIAFFAE